jgi:hypothetical protein
MNTNEQDFETQWKLREEELMKLPKEAVIGIHKLQSQLMFNSYYPMQARIQELEGILKELESFASEVVKHRDYQDPNRNIFGFNNEQLKAGPMHKIVSLLQSSKQL